VIYSMWYNVHRLLSVGGLECSGVLRVKELSSHFLTIFTKFDNTVIIVAGLSAQPLLRDPLHQKKSHVVQAMEETVLNCCIMLNSSDIFSFYYRAM